MQHDTGGQRSVLRRAVRLSAAFALSIGVCSAGAMAQDYHLQPGDVIEISVAGMPEMGARGAIQIDGTLSLPMVGVIDAAGRPMSEIRDQIGTALSSRLRLIYLPDGSQVTRVVDYDQVSASVVEYRPVFVSGDVAQPAERPFRPGMTVRQVIAASGGVATALPTATGFNPTGLRADYAVAWNAAVAAGARVWRLQKELGEEVEFDRNAWPMAPDQDGALERFLRVESEILDTRANNHSNEGAFLNEQLKQIEQQAEVMRNELEVEKKVEQTDAEALVEATGSIKKGLLTAARLQDFRSAALFSSTRRLQTHVSLMQLERQRNDVAREINRMEEVRRLDLLDELQKARIGAGQERARLFAADEKLRAMGVAPVSRPEGADIPLITVFRGGAATPEPVSFDSKIEPGDVIEVKRSAGASPFTAWLAPEGDVSAPATTVLQ